MTTGAEPDVPSRRVAIYARYSSRDEVPESELPRLRDYAATMDWTVIAEFIDHGVIGGNARRPGLDKLMDAARSRRLDGVLVFKLDRFAGSTVHFIKALKEFKALGVRFVSHQDGIDFGAPGGSAMYKLLVSLDGLFRDLIMEGIMAGVNRRRGHGRRPGRPVSVDYARIDELLAHGIPVREIARSVGASRRTVAAHAQKRRLARLGQPAVKASEIGG